MNTKAITHAAAMTEPPAALDSELECTVCQGTGRVRVLRTGWVPDYADCPNCKHTGDEITNKHMDGEQ